MDHLDRKCIADDSNVKAFEYMVKLDEFWDYRVNNDMELLIVNDESFFEISSTCDANVAEVITDMVDMVHENDSE